MSLLGLNSSDLALEGVDSGHQPGDGLLHVLLAICHRSQFLINLGVNRCKDCIFEAINTGRDGGLDLVGNNLLSSHNLFELVALCRGRELKDLEGLGDLSEDLRGNTDFGHVDKRREKARVVRQARPNLT